MLKTQKHQDAEPEGRTTGAKLYHKIRPESPEKRHVQPKPFTPYMSPLLCRRRLHLWLTCKTRRSELISQILRAFKAWYGNFESSSPILTGAGFACHQSRVYGRPILCSQVDSRGSAARILGRTIQASLSEAYPAESQAAEGETRKEKSAAAKPISRRNRS